LRTGDVDEALEELHSAVNLAPQRHEVHSNLGCAYRERGRHREAMEHFREAYRINSKDDTAALGLALLEQRLGDNKESKFILEHFLQEVNTAHTAALRQLARLHQQEENWSAAAGCYRRLIAADPTNKEWNWELQACMHQLGEAETEIIPEAPGKMTWGSAGTRSELINPAVKPWNGIVTPHGMPPQQQGHQNRSRSMVASPGQAGARSSSEQRSHLQGATVTATVVGGEVIRPEQLAFGSKIGAGGSAEVYRGAWNGQDVAIKKISGVAHLDAMKKEIIALSRFRHKRLVGFMGACVQPPVLLVITEFMPGGSLHDRLFGSRSNEPLGRAQRWSIALHVSEGLSYLHSNRVVHRDIKSMNILLDAAGNAKLCDFGLAQHMESTHMTRKSIGEAGTPRYMAPECLDPCFGRLSEKMDIWSMGCVLIELFGGIFPYHDCTNIPMLVHRISVERRPPEVPPAVPDLLSRLIRMKCLTFDAEARLQASELQSKLANCARIDLDDDEEGIPESRPTFLLGANEIKEQYQSWPGFYVSH